MTKHLNDMVNGQTHLTPCSNYSGTIRGTIVDGRMIHHSTCEAICVKLFTCVINRFVSRLQEGR